MKKSVNISNNYKYYDFHPNLKYRYPAPGSCELAKKDHPNLYKKHWKTPYRYSQFNIRPKEKFEDFGETTVNYISTMPELDPNNPAED